MTESRIELTDRLRREGRWAEASVRKDEIVKMLRAEGMKRAEAGDEAWRRIADEFPPLTPDRGPEVEPVADEAEVAIIASPLPEDWDEIAESAPFEAEVEWVHQNRVLVVEERDGRPSRLHWHRARKPAPSYGALSLMEYAAMNKKGFMDILQKVKPRMGSEEDVARRSKMQVEQIRDILRELRDAEGIGE